MRNRNSLRTANKYRIIDQQYYDHLFVDYSKNGRNVSIGYYLAQRNGLGQVSPNNKDYGRFLDFFVTEENITFGDSRESERNFFYRSSILIFAFLQVYNQIHVKPKALEAFKNSFENAFKRGFEIHEDQGEEKLEIGFNEFFSVENFPICFNELFEQGQKEILDESKDILDKFYKGKITENVFQSFQESDKSFLYDTITLASSKIKFLNFLYLSYNISVRTYYTPSKDPSCLNAEKIDKAFTILTQILSDLRFLFDKDIKNFVDLKREPIGQNKSNYRIVYSVLSEPITISKIDFVNFSPELREILQIVFTSSRRQISSDKESSNSKITFYDNCSKVLNENIHEVFSRSNKKFVKPRILDEEVKIKKYGNDLTSPNTSNSIRLDLASPKTPDDCKTRRLGNKNKLPRKDGFFKPKKQDHIEAEIDNHYKEVFFIPEVIKKYEEFYCKTLETLLNQVLSTLSVNKTIFLSKSQQCFDLDKLVINQDDLNSFYAKVKLPKLTNLVEFLNSQSGDFHFSDTIDFPKVFSDLKEGQIPVGVFMMLCLLKGRFNLTDEEFRYFSIFLSKKNDKLKISDSREIELETQKYKFSDFSYFDLNAFIIKLQDYEKKLQIEKNQFINLRLEKFVSDLVPEMHSLFFQAINYKNHVSKEKNKLQNFLFKSYSNLFFKCLDGLNDFLFSENEISQKMFLHDFDKSLRFVFFEQLGHFVNILYNSNNQLPLFENKWEILERALSEIKDIINSTIPDSNNCSYQKNFYNMLIIGILKEINDYKSLSKTIIDNDIENEVEIDLPEKLLGFSFLKSQSDIESCFLTLFNKSLDKAIKILACNMNQDETGKVDVSQLFQMFNQQFHININERLKALFNSQLKFAKGKYFLSETSRVNYLELIPLYSKLSQLNNKLELTLLKESHKTYTDIFVKCLYNDLVVFLESNDPKNCYNAFFSCYLKNAYDIFDDKNILPEVKNKVLETTINHIFKNLAPYKKFITSINLYVISPLDANTLVQMFCDELSQFPNKDQMFLSYAHKLGGFLIKLLLEEANSQQFKSDETLFLKYFEVYLKQDLLEKVQSIDTSCKSSKDLIDEFAKLYISYFKGLYDNKVDDIESKALNDFQDVCSLFIDTYALEFPEEKTEIYNGCLASLQTAFINVVEITDLESHSDKLFCYYLSSFISRILQSDSNCLSINESSDIKYHLKDDLLDKVQNMDTSSEGFTNLIDEFAKLYISYFKGLYDNKVDDIESEALNDFQDVCSLFIATYALEFPEEKTEIYNGLLASLQTAFIDIVARSGLECSSDKSFLFYLSSFIERFSEKYCLEAEPNNSYNSYSSSSVSKKIVSQELTMSI
ncbi:MAG: hypothetical protein ISQ32_05390 [Rickettsiales bacterium]|nr:hypothetical protein [Rickettsiales bacterium]